MKRFIEGRETVKDDDRSGCPLNVSTEINVSKVEQYVMKDRRVTIREIANDLSMSYGTVQEILTSKLNMRRVCASWVPRLLLPEQIRVRVNACRSYVSEYEKEQNSFINRIITCDETWVHFYEPEILKDYLRGEKYESREDLGTAVNKVLRVMSRDGIDNVFCAWADRWEKCIKS
ncbi:histone-lysine N-methyltransferase SETMAR-like [Saccostrea cucullata]|uniref:histone-lysine N-methyltransferase SETMAR-like n=1 Tax=Saccostrea cuccullata TaxID=36930 RepID=UPI002ED243D5